MTPQSALAPRLRSWIALALLVLAALVHLDSRRYADPDLFVTLYTGREIAEIGGPPRVETRSYTAAGGPWRDYEWVSRLLFFEVYDRFEGPGLVAVRAGVILALLGLVLIQATRVGGPCAAAGGLMFVALFLREALLFRPRIFTFLGLACLMLLLDLARSRRAVLLAVPPLIAIWVNLHAGVVVGVAGVGCLLAESVVLALARRWPDRLPEAVRELIHRPTVPIAAAAAVLVVTFLASGLNPYGFAQWAGVIHSLTSAGAGGGITEWTPLYRQNLGEALLSWLLVGTVLGSVGIAWRRVPLGEAALAGVLCLASILVVRFAALLAVVGLFVFVRALGVVEPWLRERFRRLPDATGVAAALALLTALLALEGPRNLRIRMHPTLTPVAPVAFLERNGIGGRILNEYDWGGYLVWKLPESKIFVDGRYDTAYPRSVIEDWNHFVTATYDYPTVPDRYGTDLILLRRIHGIHGRLDRDQRWVAVYRDQASILYLRRSEANAKHLERFKAGELELPELEEADFLL